MKFLFSFFMVVSMAKECDKSKDSISSSHSIDKIKVTSTVNTQQEAITLDYSALNRGNYYHVLITEATILVEKNRNSKAITKACAKDDWSELMSLLSAINLKNISKLEAPTQARLYDGAATARLIIAQDKTLFETNSFDHGKPPLEIEALVKKILSLSKNIEKQ